MLFSLITFIVGRYQASMLRSLKEVRSDDSVVGFYQAVTMGAFYSQSLVDVQAIHQEKLRHGGVVVVHGTFLKLVETLKMRDLKQLVSLLLQISHKRNVEMPPFAHLNYLNSL